MANSRKFVSRLLLAVSIVANVCLSILLLLYRGCEGTGVDKSAPSAVALSTLYDRWPLSLRAQQLETACGQISRAAENQGIRITAEMPTHCKLGEKMTLSLVLENRRSSDVVFDHNVDESDFYLEVVDSRYQPISLTQRGKQWLGNPYAYDLNSGMTLRPNQAVSRKVNLTECFVLTSPGLYRLTVVKPVRGIANYATAGRDLEVAIDQMVFQVDPAGE